MVPTLLAVALLGATWVETAQPDFADGTFESNVYASWRDGGAIEFTNRFDLNKDGYIDLFVSDRDVRQTHIHWGADSGYYPENRTSYPSLEPVDPLSADLDFDGWPEFISNSRGGGELLVFAGEDGGPSPNRGFRLPGPDCFGAGMLAADFDKNGYLDLTIGGYASSQQTYVYWGDENGYSAQNRTVLPGDQPCHNPEVADFNKDGWLDFLQSCDVDPQQVYWGSPDGFSPENRTQLYSPGHPRHHGKSTADLNKDGWLDLVFTTQSGQGSYIYWGSADGFTTRTELNPGSCDGGSAIADMNRDGFLDIVYAVSYRTAPRIYWGSRAGYSDENSTTFGCAGEYLGVFIADLNGNGDLDIFMNNNDFGGPSRIFWGPLFKIWTSLPTSLDHYVCHIEPGNKYDRSYCEEYLSSVYDAGGTCAWQDISWDATTPGRTTVITAIRTGDTPRPSRAWSGWLLLRNGSRIPDTMASRYIQYRATFGYETPATVPTLLEMRINHYTFNSDATPVADFTAPTAFAVGGCWPNPFGPRTTIGYSLPRDCRAVIRVFNANGQLVRSLGADHRTTGHYDVAWDGRSDSGEDLPSGVYLCRLVADGEYQASAMVSKMR
jgi:hypothetical protein